MKIKEIYIEEKSEGFSSFWEKICSRKSTVHLDSLQRCFLVGHLEIVLVDAACELVGLESLCHLYNVYFELYFKGLVL